MLAPNSQDAIDQLTGLVNTNAAMTGWNQSLLNTVLPRLDPVPAWYDAIDAAIGPARTTASDWVTAKGPAAFAAITQGYVDYANLFVAVAAQLKATVDQVNAGGGIPDADAVARMLSLVQMLKGRSDQLGGQMAGLIAQFGATRDQIKAMRQALSAAIDAATKDAAADAAAIESLRQQVATIMTTIAVLSDEISAADIAADGLAAADQVMTRLRTFSAATQSDHAATINALTGQIDIPEQVIENSLPSIMATPTQRYITVILSPGAIDWATAPFDQVQVEITAKSLSEGGTTSTLNVRRSLAWFRGDNEPAYVTYPVTIADPTKSLPTLTYTWSATYIKAGADPRQTAPVDSASVILDIPALPPG